MFAEPGGTFVFGYVSAAGLPAVILTEGCDAVDELGDNLASFLSGFGTFRGGQNKHCFDNKTPAAGPVHQARGKNAHAA